MAPLRCVIIERLRPHPTFERRGDGVQIPHTHHELVWRLRVREPTAALLKVVVVRQAEEVPASTPWLARVSKRKPHATLRSNFQIGTIRSKYLLSLLAVERWVRRTGLLPLDQLCGSTTAASGTRGCSSAHTCALLARWGPMDRACDGTGCAPLHILGPSAAAQGRKRRREPSSCRA